MIPVTGTFKDSIKYKWSLENSRISRKKNLVESIFLRNSEQRRIIKSLFQW